MNIVFERREKLIVFTRVTGPSYIKSISFNLDVRKDVCMKIPKNVPRPFSAIRIYPNSKNRNFLKIAKSKLYGTVNFIEIGRFLAI